LGHTPGDSAQLAESIISLVENRELRAQLGAEGRRTAEKRFDRKRMVLELIRLYDEVSLSRRLQGTALAAVAGAGRGTP
jgi:glycosyltransferase involved in cell wall biosynthesis